MWTELLPQQGLPRPLVASHDDCGLRLYERLIRLKDAPGGTAQDTLMRALIIDDQPLIVCGPQALLSSLEIPAEVSCADSPRAARLMLSSDPGFDLVLFDLALEKSADLAFLSEHGNICLSQASPRCGAPAAPEAVTTVTDFLMGKGTCSSSTDAFTPSINDVHTSLTTPGFSACTP